MIHSQSKQTLISDATFKLATLILAIPPARRGAVLQSVVSFCPNRTVDDSFDVGPVRAAFAEYWENALARPVPFEQLRDVLNPPVPIKTVLEFSKFVLVRDVAEAASALAELIEHLRQHVAELQGSTQLSLFPSGKEPKTDKANFTPIHGTVSSLNELVERGYKFSTFYADPPWPYENEASRAAAVNHYPSMSLEQICAEPVERLAADDAHLHLWTTNAFLREAFVVIEAWGFRYKSCLVWIKDEIGMGNYWRLSHEFLFLGVRGSLTFRDRTRQSWIQAHRTTHSRKPGLIRSLVEQVSPGPYLELYGREELPNSAWTVYGNQIERRLF